MPSYKLLIAQFPGNFQTHPDVSDWLIDVTTAAKQDPRIGSGNVTLWRASDTPITMCRNRCLVLAEKAGVDYVLMVDADMSPDLPFDGHKPFWESSFNFMLQHDGPCVIAAPYCMAPPEERVNVFQWVSRETNHPNPDFILTNYPRAEAAIMTGIKPVNAAGTGLILIDMRAVRKMPHPRFYYEYSDKSESHKNSTEDVTFTRDLGYAGVPMYCNWDAWAGHHKSKLVIKPCLVPPANVARWMKEAVAGYVQAGIPLQPSQVQPSQSQRANKDTAGG